MCRVLIDLSNMLTPEFRLYGGSTVPRCEVHVDKRFPDYIAIQFCALGQMNFVRGRAAQVTFEQPTFFWTDLRHRYRYWPGPAGFWHHHWVAFQGKCMRAYYLPLLNRLAPKGYLELAKSEAMQEAFEAAIEMVTERPDFPKAERLAIDHILYVAWRDRRQLKKSRSDRLERLRQEMMAHPETRYEWKETAARLGFSTSHFRRLFSERYGHPPQEYMLQCRMQKAARLLREGELSVQEISYALGYEDPAQFSHVFKKKYGLSPRNYRAAMPL